MILDLMFAEAMRTSPAQTPTNLEPTAPSLPSGPAAVATTQSPTAPAIIRSAALQSERENVCTEEEPDDFNKVLSGVRDLGKMEDIEACN